MQTPPTSLFHFFFRILIFVDILIVIVCLIIVDVYNYSLRYEIYKIKDDIRSLIM